MTKKGDGEGNVVEKTVVTTTTKVKKGSPKKKKTTTTKVKKTAPKKKTTRKKSSSTRKSTPKTNEAIPQVLIENFVALQRVLADLSGKLNDLTNQTSKLLGLFEESAKTLMEKDINLNGGEDKEVVEKLDKLLDQNKVLAQGIALLHESEPQQEAKEEEAPQNQMPPGAQPQIMQQNAPPKATPQDSMNKYQRSISSKY
jgi:hypothetical protein